MIDAEGNTRREDLQRTGGEGLLEGECCPDSASAVQAEPTDGATIEEETKEAETPVLISVGTLISEAALDPESGIAISDIRHIADAGRQNDKRSAYIKFAVPDEHVKNLTGFDGMRDVYLLLRIPRAYAENMGAL